MTPRESSGILARPPRIQARHHRKGSPCLSSESLSWHSPRSPSAPSLRSGLRRPTPASSRSLSNYKGAGTVDKSHQIFVWVFDTPTSTTNSTPISSDVITSNGGTAFVLGPAEDGLSRRRLQREGRLRRHAGSPADRHARDHLRRHGHGDGGRDRRRRGRSHDHLRRLRQNAVAPSRPNVAQVFRPASVASSDLKVCATDSLPCRSFVTRPTSTHSTTKMLPA